MSRFGENVLDLFWAVGEGALDRLKDLSSSLVEDDEYVLIFVLFLGVPSIVAMIFIARHIRRTHDRVRYASEYVEQDPNAFATSSSSATDSEDSSSSDDERHAQTAKRRYTMDEVSSLAQRLTEQEAVRRRAARRAAAAAAEAEAAEAAAHAETASPSSASPSASLLAPAETSDKKNDE